MKLSLRRLGWIFGVLLLVASGCVLTAGAYLRHWASSPMAHQHEVELRFAPGANLHTLALDLQQLGVLKRPWLLRLWARNESLATRLQSGEYRIPVGETPQRLLQRLHRGSVIQHRLRIVEGGVLAQMLAALEADDRLLATPRTATIATLREELCYATLGVQDIAGLEGLFAPETYAFARGTTAAELLLRAHRRLCEQLAQLQTAHAGVFNSGYEALILASIIEKETGRDAERSDISQVFHNRLRRGMRLQTDPTVIYALGEDFDGDIRRADLQIDSPYNTYRVKGLPPTPIAAPSLASLEAAFQPSQGELLYFVARGDGTSQFSVTLEAHNAAVRKFQLGLSD